MNKTKKNGFLKVASLMLVVMMLATCVLASTMAKYTSTGSVSGIEAVTPAKWDVTVNDTSLTTGLSSLSWNIAPIAAGPDNEAVVEDKIAPGTWGYAEIIITNKSEVKVTVDLSQFTAPTVSAPSTGLTFGCYATTDKKTTYAEMAAGDNLVSATKSVELAAAEGSTYASTYVYVVYQWLYTVDGNTSDVPDTNLGSTAAAITFDSSTLTITATQVEPNKAD